LPARFCKPRLIGFHVDDVCAAQRSAQVPLKEDRQRRALPQVAQGDKVIFVVS
jgi:hypothetical protein